MPPRRYIRLEIVALTLFYPEVSDDIYDPTSLIFNGEFGSLQFLTGRLLSPKFRDFAKKLLRPVPKILGRLL